MDQKLDRPLYAVDDTGLMLDLFKRPLPGDVDQLPYLFRFHPSEVRQHILPHIVGGEVAPLTLPLGVDHRVGKVGGLGIDDLGCCS